MGRQKDGVRRVLKAFFCVTCHKSTRQYAFQVWKAWQRLLIFNLRAKIGDLTKRTPPTRGNRHFLKKTAKLARFFARVFSRRRTT